MGFKQHISRTWQMIEQQVNDVPFRPDDEALGLKKRCGTTVTGDATSGLTPLLYQFTLNSTWLLRSAPSLTGCFL